MSVTTSVRHLVHLQLTFKGTTGLGKSTVTQLATHKPAHIYFTGRNERTAASTVESCKAAAPDVPVTFLPCDLASLAAVRDAARSFQQQQQRLDILICNAGIMALPPAVTTDGYEIQFGTNHVGHALLIQQLLPLLRKSSDARMVSLTSQGHAFHPSDGIKFSTLKTSQDGWLAAKWTRYGQSKLANILYAKELSKRYPEVLAVAVHPGVITSGGLVGNLGYINKAFVKMMTIGATLTAEQGAFNTMWAATAPRSEVKAGEYYEPVGEAKAPSGKGNDMELAAKLWEWTEKELEPWM